MWLWGFLVVISIMVFICWRLTDIILYPVTFTPEETLEKEVTTGHMILETFLALPKENITINSPYGYALFGLYIPNEDTDKTVIISHGITQNAIRSLRYMEPFYRRGFNILLIEHRNHGRSGGTNTSYGCYEKFDLKVWVDWLYQINGKTGIVGVHGESMGAAIAILHAAIDARVAFIVADCAYARIADEFAYRLKVEYHLPRFPIIPLSSLVCKLRAGYTFDCSAPLDVIPQVQIPILFIHGANDDYIPPQHSRAMFAVKAGMKELWLAPGSKHAGSQSDHPDAYNRHIDEFLDSIGIT